MGLEFGYEMVVSMQEQRLKEAAHARLVRAVCKASAAPRTQRMAPLVHALGSRLEAWGRRLQERSLHEELPRRELAQ